MEMKGPKWEYDVEKRETAATEVRRVKEKLSESLSLGAIRGEPEYLSASLADSEKAGKMV